ncbi:ComEC/Rec2 family competence protein [Pseudozobellia thermophila]|uniref:Competence protein ComEC n=1 Tax=Pseudozobellia thermophila TaxID=192903 RepID=A0A1M6D4K0_9FLAO|nr:ComEC/Rec2 family competence protein [Pseudozobellia thermophila]SHI68205.1 competence protein ComEC [Pseudozobellia thermophila]
MKPLRFIPIKLTFLLVVGIVLGKHLQLGLLGPTLLNAVLLLFLALGYQKADYPLLFGINTSLLTIGIGILAISIAQPGNRPDHYSKRGLDGSQIWQLKIREVLKPTDFSNRYIAVTQALGDQKVSGKILLNTRPDPTQTPFKIDDEIIVYGRLQEIRPPLNPHQFDYRKYMANLGVIHQLEVRPDAFWVRPDPSKTWYGRAWETRDKIIKKLEAHNFGEEELSIIQALLLGQRSDISETTYTNYKNAGAVHILALSGLHIGILLLILQFLLRPLELLPKGKVLKLALVVALLWGFALLAGFSASIVRAVTMFSFVAYALFLNRPSNTFNILALSMFFILLVIDPNLLFQVGFQMSYAAVLSIVSIYPVLLKFWHPKNKIVRYFWQLLSVSIAAQCGVLPLSLFYFHQFPGLFFVSNLIIVPVLGLILGMGLLVVLLASFHILPDFLVEAYDAVIRWMNQIIAWVAQHEAFIFKHISFDSAQLLLGYIILLSLIAFLGAPNFKRLATLGLAIIGFQMWALFTAYRTSQKETLILAHQSKNSVLLYRYGKKARVFSRDSTALDRLVSGYRVGERIKQIAYRPLQNSYHWHKRKVLIIDSLAAYPVAEEGVDFLILTQSPKINLGRLIDSLRPEVVLADGSNYRSYVDRWSSTCSMKKLPFHYTGEKGAYYFDP